MVYHQNPFQEKTLAAQNAHFASAKYHEMPSPNHVGKTLVT
jgi:hypothetical protein